MKDFRTKTDVQTRFRDQDSLGHVNNAVYLSYLEVARLEYLKEAFGLTDYAAVDIIVARVEIDYRRAVKAPEPLVVGVRVSRIGGASFDMEYRIEEKKTGALVAEAKSVQVFFDYETKKVKRPATDVVRRMKEYDGLA